MSYPASTVLPSGWRGRATVGSAIVISLGIAGFGGVYPWVWAPLLVVTCGGVCATLFAAALSGKPLPWSWLLAPALGFLALTVWQWIGPFSIDRAATLTGILQLVLPGGVFYLALFGMQSRRSSRWAGRFLWALTGVLAVEAIFQYFTANGFIYWFRDANYGTPVGPYIYHNHFAGCMLLLMPAAVVVAFRRDCVGDSPWYGWVRRGLVPALGLASLVISQSRGGILALLFEGGMALALLWRPRRAQRHRLVAGCVAAILLLGFAYLANLQPVWNRFAELAHHDPSAVDRILMTESCWNIFRDHAWIGTGWETFADIYPRYALFDSGLQVDHAHDEYMQTLAETGAVGALFALAFASIYLIGYLRRRGMLAGYDRALCHAAFLGTAGFLAQSSVDFEFHSPANAMLFFFCCALAAAPLAAVGKRAAVVETAVHAQHPIAIR